MTIPLFPRLVRLLKLSGFSRPNNLPSDIKEVMHNLDSIHEANPHLEPRVFSSTVCREQHFRMPLYSYWCNQIKERPRFHRKQWEFVYICQALYERDMLRAGRNGLAFGVGKEPLPALFASKGVGITATDLDSEKANCMGWAKSNQHSSSLSDLNEREICEDATFNALVKYRTVDMNDIPMDLKGFDFCWSSCALEHLGSIAAGTIFIENSLDTLKPGGIAIHTTELNVSSSENTIDNNPSCVLFRKKDIEALASSLKNKGYFVEPVDYYPGNDTIEKYVDLPPYRSEPHLRLQMEEYVTTSIGLIIHKP